MIEIPAEVFRKSSSQSAHHCHVDRAWPRVNSFAARCAGIVIGMAEALQLVLVDQVMADAAEGFDDAVVFALEDGLGDLDLHDLFAHREIDFQMLVDAPGWRKRCA